MTAKELLNKIISIRKSIDYRKTKLEAAVKRAVRTTPHLTGMPHNPSSDSSMLATAVSEKIDLEREISELEEERKALIAKIDLLGEDDYSRILVLRYAHEEKWETIMAEMNYSPSWTYHMHLEAIKRLDVILKEQSKTE